MYYNRVEALNLFTEKIENQKPFVYAKFGDGELACMNGEIGHNCDHHPYSKKLGDELTKSFINLNKNFDDVYIANWEDDSYSDVRNKICHENNLQLKLVYYDTMLHTKGQLDEHIYSFIKALKESKQRKIFFGPKRLDKVISFLNLNIYIEVKLKNAFSLYENYLKWVSENIKENDIFIFSSGMMSKPLIYKCKSLGGKNTTCIDMGSSFDPIFVGKTRLKQENYEKLNKFYKNIL